MSRRQRQDRSSGRLTGFQAVGRIAAAIGVLALAFGCASTRVAPIEGAEHEPEAEDERQLWELSEKLDEYYQKQGYVYEDNELQEYVQEVAEKLLVSFDASGARVRVRVLRDPFRNAAASPNGSVYLHMGMLASLENEAQLATLLGHELTHYVRRHSLKENRAAKNRRTVANVFLGTLLVIGSLGGDPGAAMNAAHDLNDALDPLLERQVNGYSQDLEREADRMGFEAMVAVGYDPQEAPEIFRVLLQERAALVPEPYYFGSHPHLEERLESYERELARARLASYERELAEAGSTDRSGEALRVGRTEYEQRVGQLLLDNARLDLRLGRLEFAKRAVARHVRIVPDSAEGYFFQGQLLRKHSGGPDDLKLAAASYEAAARLNPDDAESHRELGLLYRSMGEEGAARTSLQRYVELEPAAVDRPIIEGYIDALREPSGSMQGE